MRVAVANLVRLLVEIDAIGEHGRGRDAGTGLHDELGIAVFQVLPHADLRGKAPRILHGRNAGDDERVRAHLLDALPDLAIQTVDDRGDGDHGGYSDDNSEDGQAGAQLTGAQRAECGREVLREFVPGHPVSARKAATGSSAAAFFAG